ncbi:membrane protein insertase YidC [Desulfovulcanus sp.]
MDNKRVLIAVVLSLAVLVIWNWLFPPVPPKQNSVNQTQIQNAASKQAKKTDQIRSSAVQANSSLVFNPAKGQKITIETPLYKAVFNSQGGILEHFILKKYKQSIEPDAPNIDLITPEALPKGPLGIVWNKIPTWIKAEWSTNGDDKSLSSGQTHTLSFVGRLGNLELHRQLTFYGDSYQIKETLQLINLTSDLAQGELSFIISSPSLSKEGDRYNRTRIAYFNKDGLSEEADKDDLKLGLKIEPPVQWGAITSNYFLLSLIPGETDMTFKTKLEENIYRLALSQNIQIAANIPAQISCTYYLGPKDEKCLSKAPGNLQAAIHYGWFDIIAKPLIKILNFFYKYTGNYGLAIIILTIIIKLLFWPLSQKSYKSMNQMKKLQPMMAKIREKYKDDRQKMNEELMRLYKTYKVNPAGGCLPMFIQIPVFFALYQALLGAIELRHAPFIHYLPFTNMVWLADLSAKDPFYITPLIMGATMFIQQKMTPAPGDPTQAKIMLFMPIVFTFLFMNFPSGLVIYWLVNNLLSIAQQWWMLKKS